MADIKISELLPASTPLDGTETLPIVQSGNTVKASTQDIASLYSLGYTAENVANKSTDSSFAGASDLKYPSQLAVKTYVDNTLGNAGWGLNGNSGTTSANFIGTTDNVDLVLKANNSEVLIIASNGANPSYAKFKGVVNSIDNVEAGFYATNPGFTKSSWITSNFNSSGKPGLAISEAYVGNIRLGTLTADRTYSLPDTSGTLAIEDYKVYTALITYAGSNVVNATVLKNTMGVSFAWTNPSNGIARITATSGSPFTTGKTWISNGCANIGGTPYLVTGDLAGNIIVNFRFFLHDGTISTTPGFTNYSIEIRVYP